MAQLGPYALLEELGRGAMGVVYRARHTALDRIVALKVVAPEMVRPMAIARLRREAQAAARLAEVPGIVAVRDVGESDGTVYVAMDFIDGRPFDAVLADGELPMAERIAVVAQAARAVHAAHAHGVLHRDLKPANILIDRDGRPWVADFGLAQMVPADAEVTKLTRTDEILGTPAYMAPEQVHAAGTDARTDVYSLGATLYQAATGRLPFESDSMIGVLAKVLRETPPPPSAIPTEPLPPGLETVILAALAKSPSERPPTAAALADDLERVLRGEAVGVRAPRRAAPWRRRVSGIAVGGLVVAGAIAAGVVALRGDERRVRAAEAATGRAQLAADLPQIYLELTRGSGAAMAVLEDHWNHVPVAEGAVAEALERVRAAAAAAEDGRPQLRLPRAWRVLGEAFASRRAGDPDGLDGIAQLEALGGGDDPYPELFAAHVALAALSAVLEAPEFFLTEHGYVPGDRPDTPEAAALRRRAAALVDAARRAPLYATLPGAGNYRELLAAGADVAANRYAAAAPRLRPLVDDPMLAGVAAPMLGLALLHAGDAAAGAAALETPRIAHWQAMQHNAVLAHCAAARTAEVRGEDPLPHLERAAARADHLVQLAPERPAWLESRLRVWFLRAGCGPFVSQLTADDYAAVEADLARFEASEGAAARAAEWRVELNLLYLQLPGIAPAPPEELERRTVAALQAWERLGGRRVDEIEAERARLWEVRAAQAGAAERPTLPYLQRAAEAWDRAVALNPANDSVLGRAGVAFVNAGEAAQEAGDREAAATAFERALQLCTRWHRVAPESGDPLVNRAVVHRLRGDLTKANGGEAAPHYRAAVADAEAATAAAPGDWQALAVLAIARSRLHDWKGAEAALQEALKADPGNAYLTGLLQQVQRALKR